MKSVKIISLALVAAILISVCISAFPVSAAEELPEKYDSRDHGYITPVRNQLGYGTCWAHGALAACEASLIKNNGYPSDLDLSEFHAAYCTYHAMYDRLGLFQPNVNDSFLQTYMNDGGDEELAAIAFANWNGPVTDSAHYSEFTSKKFELSGLNQLDFASKQLQYCMNAAQLKDYYTVNTSDIQKIKEYVMKYGAGTIGLASSSSFRDEEKGVWFYNYETRRYTDGGHAMAIVGWDDTITAEQLSVNGVTPSQDGAFIVKNSWGEYRGINGYYYVPYEEAMLDGTSLFFSFNDAGTYTYNYGYDCSNGTRFYYDSDSTDTVSAGNIYTATADDETLEAVSFYPTADNIGYEVSVYTGIPENAASPIQGELKVTLSGTADRGYRTVELPQAISLTAGERFSVVVKFTGGNTDKTTFKCSADETGEGKHTRGKSFVYSTARGWHDICDADNQEYFGYARVKAFTNSASAPQLTEPEDYTQYDNTSREQLLSQTSDALNRFETMENEGIRNYNKNDLELLSCYENILNSIITYPDMFTASEIYATKNNFTDLMDNVRPLDPTSILENLDIVALKIVSGKAGEGSPYWQEFKDEYDRVLTMAKNKEITADNFADLQLSLGNAFLKVLVYMIENGYGGSSIQHYGDINHDGDIDVRDATLLQRFVAELEENNFFANQCGDVNRDFTVSIGDVTMIQQLCAQMIDHLAVYDYDCDITDDFTEESSLESIKEYLSDSIEERNNWELVTPTIYRDFDEIKEKVIYDNAKKTLAEADSKNKAELLFCTRNLIDSVRKSPWG